MAGEIKIPGGMIMWFRHRNRILSVFGALMRLQCRDKVHAEGVVSKALARAVAFQEDPYEKMLMGRRPDFG